MNAAILDWWGDLEGYGLQPVRRLSKMAGGFGPWGDVGSIRM